MAGSPAKLLHVLGLLAKIESTYGTFVAPSTTSDGVQLQYKDRVVAAPASIDYAFNGDLGPSVSALGQVANVAASGRAFKADFPMRSRPAGVAYATATIPSIHNLLKIAGFDATVTTSIGSEKWTYTPTAPGNGYASASMGLYCKGELWNAAGVIANLKFDAPDPAPPIWTASCMGILNALPSDAALPAITYPLQTIPPQLASSISLTLGSLTANAVVLAHSFDLQRTMDPRVAQSSSGAHLGFVPKDRAPIIKVTLEATALVGSPFTSSTAFDPYNLRESGQSLAVTLQHGSAQYFRTKINFPQAQVIDYKLGNNGAVATCELTLQAYNSTASSNDDINIVFD
jgi:hypothetical protein